MAGQERADAGPDERVRVGNQNADQSSLKGEPCTICIRYTMTRNERKSLSPWLGPPYPSDERSPCQGFLTLRRRNPRHNGWSTTISLLPLAINQ